MFRRAKSFENQAEWKIKFFLFQMPKIRMNATITFFFVSFLSSLLASELFVNGFGDIPIYKDMKNVDDSLILFDKVTGRYVSSEIIGDYKKGDVKDFYIKVLPNLGWERIGDDLFLRGKETLEIDYKQEKLKTRVRFSVSPQK